MDIFYNLIRLIVSLDMEKEGKDITKYVKEVVEITKAFYALFPLSVAKFLTFAISSLNQNFEIRKVI